MRKYFALLKETFKEFGQDKAPRLGAALAYYTIFSIGPLLLLAVSMAGLFFGEEAARGQVSRELQNVFGSQMAEGVEQTIQAAAKPESGMVATIVGIVTLLLGASGVFGQLKDALNTIWNVQPKKVSGIKSLIRQRFLSVTMVLGIGFLLLVTLIIDAVLSAMGGYVERMMAGAEILHAIQLLVSFAVVTVLFAAIYRILPDLKIAWRDVWLGAIITSLLFVIGKFALGLYLGRAAIGSAYGAAGSLVILLMWVYWSAQILFLGAEFTQVYARTYGSLKGDTSKREARAQADRPEDRPRPDRDGIPAQAVVSRPAGAPVLAPMYGRASSGGNLMKIAAGGIAGLLFGAILGGVSALGLVFKTVRKVILPFR